MICIWSLNGAFTLIHPGCFPWRSFGACSDFERAIGLLDWRNCSLGQALPLLTSWLHEVAHSLANNYCDCLGSGVTIQPYQSFEAVSVSAPLFTFWASNNLSHTLDPSKCRAAPLWVSRNLSFPPPSQIEDGPWANHYQRACSEYSGLFWSDWGHWPSMAFSCRSTCPCSRFWFAWWSASYPFVCWSRQDFSDCGILCSSRKCWSLKTVSQMAQGIPRKSPFHFLWGLGSHFLCRRACRCAFAQPRHFLRNSADQWPFPDRFCDLFGDPREWHERNQHPTCHWPDR